MGPPTGLGLLGPLLLILLPVLVHLFAPRFESAIPVLRVMAVAADRGLWGLALLAVHVPAPLDREVTFSVATAGAINIVLAFAGSQAGSPGHGPGLGSGGDLGNPGALRGAQVEKNHMKVLFYIPLLGYGELERVVQYLSGAMAEDYQVYIMGQGIAAGRLALAGLRAAPERDHFTRSHLQALKHSALWPQVQSILKVLGELRNPT